MLSSPKCRPAAGLGLRLGLVYISYLMRNTVRKQSKRFWGWAFVTLWCSDKFEKEATKVLGLGHCKEYRVVRTGTNPFQYPEGAPAALC